MVDIQRSCKWSNIIPEFESVCCPFNGSATSPLFTLTRFPVAQNPENNAIDALKK